MPESLFIVTSWDCHLAFAIIPLVTIQLLCIVFTILFFFAKYLEKGGLTKESRLYLNCVPRLMYYLRECHEMLSLIQHHRTDLLYLKI